MCGRLVTVVRIALDLAVNSDDFSNVLQAVYAVSILYILKSLGSVFHNIKVYKRACEMVENNEIELDNVIKDLKNMNVIDDDFEVVEVEKDS